MHDFRLRDAQCFSLVEHGGIWLLELNKFHAELVRTEQERWLKFFKEGATLDSEALPPWMQTPEMEQAMSTLRGFSEKERAYHAYQARQNYLRQQASIQEELEDRRAEVEQARLAAEQAHLTAEHERLSAEQAHLTAQQARAAEQQALALAEQAQAAAERERTAREQERTAKEVALAELERLKADLRPEADK